MNLRICESIESGARESAKKVVRAILWSIAAPLIVFSAIKLVDPPWLHKMPDSILWMVGGAAIVVASLAVLDSLGQGNVKQWLAPMEEKLARSITRRRKKSAGMEETTPLGDDNAGQKSLNAEAPVLTR